LIWIKPQPEARLDKNSIDKLNGAILRCHRNDEAHRSAGGALDDAEAPPEAVNLKNLDDLRSGRKRAGDPL
jgi:hypothetical protein